MKKILFLLLGLVLIVSCGDKGTKLKGKTVTFNIEAEPSSLDPQLLTDMGGFMISNATYENVVRLNEKNEIVPAGAESYTVSPDGKIWTFKLRKDAKWSKFGFDLCLGMNADKTATETDLHFLPEMLSESLAQTVVEYNASKKEKLTQVPTYIIQANEKESISTDSHTISPLSVSWLLFAIVLTITIFAYIKKKKFRMT